MARKLYCEGLVNPCLLYTSTIDKTGRELYQPVQPIFTRCIKKTCRSIKSKRTGYIYN